MRAAGGQVRNVSRSDGLGYPIATGRMATFVACVFLLSWAVWVPMALIDAGVIDLGFRIPLLAKDIASWAPSLAALGLAALGSVPSPRELGRALLRWRVRLAWYFVVLLGPAMLALLALAAWNAISPDAVPPLPGLFDFVYFPLVFAYVLVLGGPLGEESGWRGYLLPGLLGRMSAASAALVVGIVWALWHTPLFWIEGTVQADLPIGWYMTMTVGLSFIYTWVFLRTQGSVLIAVLLHTASNAWMGFLPILPASVQPGPIGLFPVLAAVVLFLGALAATSLARRKD
ncbi:MAG: CPBP family intramembrane metalloprotease [Actinobacteria bacterium]|nr:MAG: CPBP family intramembrane metalloprotease [Actinomycetota bacterium]